MFINKSLQINFSCQNSIVRTNRKYQTFIHEKSAICWPSYLYSLIPERALFFAIISQNDIPSVALPS